MRLRRPSHTTVVAYLALVAAMSGTAVAATSVLKNGDTLIAERTLSGNRLRTNSVTGTQVKESTLGTVPRAATANALKPLAWHPLKLTDGWTTYPGARPAAWALDAEGIVHLRGAIQRTSGTSFVFAAIPAPVDPSAQLWIPVDMVNGSTGRIEVLPQSGFQVQDTDSGDDATWFTSLEGVTYSVQ